MTSFPFWPHTVWLGVGACFYNCSLVCVCEWVSRVLLFSRRLFLDKSARVHSCPESRVNYNVQIRRENHTREYGIGSIFTLLPSPVLTIHLSCLGMIDCGSEYFCRHRSVTSSCQTSLHPPLSWQLCSCLQVSLIFNWMIGRGLLLVQSSVTECRAESMVPPRVGGWVGMEAKEEAGRTPAELGRAGQLIK